MLQLDFFCGGGTRGADGVAEDAEGASASMGVVGSAAGALLMLLSVSLY